MRPEYSGGEDISAWRSLMVYMGGLTFDLQGPSKSLIIPNRAAASRFGHAVISRRGLYKTNFSAVNFLSPTGDLKQVLACYRSLMEEHDVAAQSFQKTE